MRKLTITKSEWNRRPGQDGRTYFVTLKHEAENSKVEVNLSNTARATYSYQLGRGATENDWDAAVRVKVMELAESGFLTPRLQISSGEMGHLFGEAKRRGLIVD